MTPCLADQTVVDLVERRIGTQARAAAEAHVEACDACRRLVAAAVLSLSSSGPEEPAPTELRRGTSVGRFVLLRTVGAGSMGVVYAAFDPELHREVALKIVRTREEPEERNARVLREARAMARLSHPNVMAVYDVGQRQDEIFIAMELVRGTTLRTWRRRAPRSWQDIVAVYAQAGRGLAVAHAAGIVHRDFKPENVLVGDDGRVRVTDFGIARWQEGAPAQTAGPSASAAAPGQGSAIAGTPAYMAPEQARGFATPASDQYAFAVALYEALYDERPFGHDRGQAGEPSFPSSAHVPPGVRRVLVRALRASPDERYPSMRELLADLEPAGRRRWTALAPAAALGAVVVAATLSARTRPAPAAPSLCAGAEERLAGVWDASRRDAVSHAILASSRPFARDTWSTVSASLDAYGRAWAAARTDACEATRIRGEQSETVLDQRMVCLDRRLFELRALTDVLARADDATVERAAQATLGLTPLSTCSALALSRGALAPTSHAVSEALARAKALRAVGQYDAAEQATRSALEGARAADEPQAVAEALAALGEIAVLRADGPAAEKCFFDALEAGERAGSEALVAHAQVGLAQSTGVFQSHPAEAERWFRLADASLEHLGDEADVDRSRVLTGRAYTLWNAYQTQAAAEAGRRAVRFAQDRLPGDWNAIAAAQSALASALGELGDLEEAQQLQVEVIAEVERHVGPLHPKLATTLNNAGVGANNLGRYDEALGYAARTLAIAETSRLPPPTVADAWSITADALAHTGRYDEARAAIARAIEVTRAAGLPPERVAHMIGNEGGIERLAGRTSDAEAHLKLALSMIERELGPRDPASVGPACDLGLLELDTGRAQLAAQQLDRVVSMAKTRDDCLAGPYALAQALWMTGRDRARARTLVDQERAYFGTHPGRAAEVRDRVAWLDAHAPELR